MKTSLHRSLFFLLAVLLPLNTLATEYSKNGWIIRKSAKETTTESGATVVYTLYVERAGPDAGTVNIVDVRGARGGTTEYLWSAPRGDLGGYSDGSMTWIRTMNEGDKFTAIYEVQVDTGLSAGTPINNYVMVDTDPYDPDLHISVDHYLVVGGGNKTKAGNRCTSEGNEPVNTATGEFFLDPITDLYLGGPLPLRFTRWYASQLNDPGIDLIRSVLGKGWMHNFESKAIHSGFWERSLRVVLPGGKVVTLAEVYGDENGWQINFEQEGVAYQGKEDGRSFWLMDPETGLLYRYDKAPFTWGSTNLLREIMDRNGNHLLPLYRADGRVTNVTDGLGRSLDFNYTASSNLLSVTDGTRTAGFGYDAQGTAVRVTNALGQVTTYTYDTDHSHTNLQGALMTGIQHPLGNIPYTQSYNANGQVVTQVSAYGAASAFAYDPISQVTQITDPQGSLSHGYESFRWATNLTDQAGNYFDIWYGTRDLPSHVTDRHGHDTTYQYDFYSRRLTNVVDRTGGTTVYSYAETSQIFTNHDTGTNYVTFVFNDLESITHPDGTTEQFQRDGCGNVTSYVDRAGSTWTTTYNGQGRPLTVTRPGGGSRTFTYNADGTRASETDSDTGITTFDYDARRRLIRVNPPAGGTTAFVLDNLDRTTAITNPAGGTAFFHFDPNGVRTNITDPAGYARIRQTDLMNRVTNRADSLGELASITYDNMSRPVRRIDPAGTNLYRYDNRGWMTNWVRGSRTWTWAYDKEGHVEEILSPLGCRISYQRDPMGRITNTTDALMHSQSSEYDASGRRIRFTDLNSNTTRYAYDDGGRLSIITNARGATASFQYDAAGLLTRASDFDGNEMTFGYTPMGRIGAITNALGDVTRQTFDAAGRLTRTDFADGTHESVVFDAAGRVQARTDGGSNTWSYGYNTRGDLVAATNPAGGVTACAYYLDGTVQSVSDSDGAAISNRYDAARRLVEMTLPDGAGMQYEYNEHGEITAIIDANSNRTEYAYDADGRCIAETDPDGHALQFHCDAGGRITNMTDRAGAQGYFEYDAGGRLTAIVDPGGVRVDYGYDAMNCRTSAAIAGQSWRRTYDQTGRLTTHSTPLGRMTTFLLDSAGRAVGLVDPMGRTNVITRDSMGRITAITDPAGRVQTFTYDGLGLLVSAGGTDTAPAFYERNGLGKVTRITDPNSNNWTFAYSLMGALTGEADPLGRSNVITRNARGQIAQIDYADGESQMYRYDPAGNVTGVVSFTGPSFAYTYDTCRRLTGAAGITLQRDAEGLITNTVSTEDGRSFGAAYDTAGRLVQADYNATFTVNYTYNPANGLLTNVADTLSGASVAFSYDADRRLTGISRGSGLDIVYTYDDASRITRIQDGTLIDVVYEYDVAGRLTAEDGTTPLNAADGLTSETPVFACDAAAQITSSGYAYDARGRLTNEPGHTFEWDVASRLIAADGAQIAYDGFHEVLKQTISGVTTRYYCNRALQPASIVAEHNDTTETFVRYYVWTPAGQMLYAIDVASGNKPLYYHFDRIGSTLAMTDENGNVTDAYAYTPFGRIVRRQGTSTQPFTFVGRHGIRQQNADGTLYQMRARYYDAYAGRFLSRDPVWPELSDARKINPYAYAGNQPVGRIDINGLWWIGPDVDPLPDDVDVTTLTDWELTEIEIKLQEMDRNDNINMPLVWMRKDRIRAEQFRRKPPALIGPPMVLDEEHKDCEELPVNTALQPDVPHVETPGLSGNPLAPRPPSRKKPLHEWTAWDIVTESFSPENMWNAHVERLIAERKAREQAAQQPPPDRAQEISRLIDKIIQDAPAQNNRRARAQAPAQGPDDPLNRRFEDPLAWVLEQMFVQPLRDMQDQPLFDDRWDDDDEPVHHPPPPIVPPEEKSQLAQQRDNLFQARQDAFHRVNDLLTAGDHQGARAAMDDLRKAEQAYNEFHNNNPFSAFYR